MSLLDTKHKRKSMTITVVLHLIILLLLFYVGMTYLDPPLEQGIAVNFGTTDEGSGNIQPTEAINSAPKRSEPEPVAQPKSEIKEEVVTQDNEDAPVIKKEETKKEQKETPKKIEPKKEPPKKPDPKPDKSTSDALSSLINGPKSEGTAKGGEGDDNKPGDKGDPNGDPNASSYYGTGKGLDGDGNYLLGGRKALNKEKFVQDCNEAGIVVVSIEVDRSGRVISATPGVRGTTNNSDCLKEPAKRAALATRFNADDKAPAKQIGKIIYRFKLSE
ncbi:MULTISPECIES: energy transducer TonB [Altibacter]|uniref:energy transducer TonB n=1 Tax=Altibacter TaxID=1535231 RepID=UPI00054D8CB9|nr:MULTISPECIES: energy transducer TonB [Altibacter]MCW8979823.1 energy transducer TonB [Altibacter sp.]MCW9036462.1 energy transducer TonB [Altibacter sp.]